MSTERDAQNEKVVLIVTLLSSFLTPYMVSSVNIALPSIGKEFAMDAIQMGWVATAYLLTTAIFLVPVGKVADIFGIKRLFSCGVVFYTLMSALIPFAGVTPLLIALRALQGVGGAMILSPCLALLGAVFPPGKRGKVMGIYVAAVYVGLSAGPFVGGILTHTLGWRSVFWSAVILGTITAYYSLFRLKGEWAEAVGESFDFAGAVIYSIALTAIMYGFTILPSGAGAWLIMLGAVGGGFFVRWEGSARHPLLDVNLFRNNAVFAFANLAALINYSAIYSVTFLMSLYLQYIKGLSSEGAGLILVSQPIVQAVFSPYVGRLSDTVDSRITTSLGMALTVICLTLFIFLDARSSMAFIVTVLMLLGFAIALFSSPNTNAVVSSVEPKYLGVASGTISTMRLMGQIFSMGIAMLIFALVIGRVPITLPVYPLFLKSLKTIFTISAVLCFGGIFASLARGKAR